MTQHHRFGRLTLFACAIALGLGLTACVSEPPASVDLERHAVAVEESAGDPVLVPLAYEEIPPRTRSELDRLLAPPSGPSPKLKCGGSIGAGHGHIVSIGCTNGKTLCFVSLWWDLDDPADGVCAPCKGKSCTPWND